MGVGLGGMRAQIFVVVVALLPPIVHAFPTSAQRGPACGWLRTLHVRRHRQIAMLRNIDDCEALIFTRDGAIDVASGAMRIGVPRLMSEAQEEGVLVALLEPAGELAALSQETNNLLADVTVYPLRSLEPGIVELSDLRKALNVEQPDGFGGSDGFGKAPGMAFGREPIAARCVVFVTTLPETAAAIGAGMRAIALPPTDGEWVDEAVEGFADACLDGLGDDADALALRLDDLSTPGSYWLNPAMPRDLNGDSIDPDTGLRKGTPQAAGLANREAVLDEEDEEDVAALLRELSQTPPSPPPQSPRSPLPPLMLLPPLPPMLSPPPPLFARPARRCAPPRAALEVTPADAAMLLQSGDATLLDVRQPAEYRLDGHVPGSCNIPAYSWEHGFYLPEEGFVDAVRAVHAAEVPIVLLCADGKLAGGAAAVLEAAEFLDVQVLDGGLRAWEWEADENDAVPPLFVDEDGEGGLTGAWV